jgi:hypothetical protein
MRDYLQDQVSEIPFNNEEYNLASGAMYTARELGIVGATLKTYYSQHDAIVKQSRWQQLKSAINKWLVNATIG